MRAVVVGAGLGRVPTAVGLVCCALCRTGLPPGSSPAYTASGSKNTTTGLNRDKHEQGRIVPQAGQAPAESPRPVVGQDATSHRQALRECGSPVAALSGAAQQGNGDPSQLTGVGREAVGGGWIGGQAAGHGHILLCS